MRQFELPGPVGDAVLQPADPVDVLLVIGAGRDDIARLAAQHCLDRRGGRAHHGRLTRGHRGDHLEERADLVVEGGAARLQSVEKPGDLGLHLVEVLLDQDAAVDHDPAAVGDAGGGQGGRAGLGFRLAAMDRVDVQRRVPRPFWDHRHRGVLARQERIERVLDLGEHRPHVADRAVTEEGHRAMRNAPLRLDLGPPHAAVAKADPVLVQGLGDDDVVHPPGREIAAFRKPGDAAEAARFLVRRRRDLDRAGEIGAGGKEGLGGDHRACEAALHVAGAAAIDPAVDQLGPERVARPAMADLDHVVMAVEMHALAGARARAPRDEIPAREVLAIAGRAGGAQQFDGESLPRQSLGQKLADLAVIAPGWVQRRHADQRLRQRNERVAAVLDLGLETGSDVHAGEASAADCRGKPERVAGRGRFR
ncbi:hypothetical protein SDC9_41672 [bioreactor metagenome]|uniref:Uncharacterized protein n=1 Tax=bioreactor metagenome TaxID=1076179 RepID=A0A644VVS7_9ZZZZ